MVFGTKSCLPKGEELWDVKGVLLQVSLHFYRLLAQADILSGFWLHIWILSGKYYCRKRKKMGSKGLNIDISRNRSMDVNNRTQMRISLKCRKSLWLSTCDTIIGFYWQHSWCLLEGPALTHWDKRSAVSFLSSVCNMRPHQRIHHSAGVSPADGGARTEEAPPLHNQGFCCHHAPSLFMFCPCFYLFSDCTWHSILLYTSFRCTV